MLQINYVIIKQSWFVAIFFDFVVRLKTSEKMRKKATKLHELNEKCEGERLVNLSYLLWVWTIMTFMFQICNSVEAHCNNQRFKMNAHKENVWEYINAAEEKKIKQNNKEIEEKKNKSLLLHTTYI